jgi:hypothetical protein
MKIQITCPQCKSSIDIEPTAEVNATQCSICTHVMDLKMNASLVAGELKECPVCDRKDFFKQKDFNRKIGVALFVIAAIASIWTYGISLIVLYLMDLFLFRKLGWAVVCYNCQTIFREIKNIDEVEPFNHEMNDRIIYSGHDFQGKNLKH